MNKLVRKLFIILNCLHGFLAADEISCVKNRTLLEVPGDAILTVFIDVNDGPYCNVTSLKGLQEISTAVHVTRILNKYNYVPDMSIGLRIFDTCHDKVVVYKQALTALTALDCTINYELSILVSESYAEVLRPFVNYSLLQINYYPKSNFSVPLMEAALDFVRGKFEVIDLLLTSPSVPIDKLFDIARQYGVCIQNHETMASVKIAANTVILAVGYLDDLRFWIKNVDLDQKATWIVLSLDDIYNDEMLPVGSYYIKSEPIDLTSRNAPSPESIDNYINATVRSIIHSPYLLNLGKSIVEISKSLRHLKERSCGVDESCALPGYVASFEKMPTAELYEALGIAEGSRLTEYAVVKKVDEGEWLKVADFRFRFGATKFTLESEVESMPGLCLNELAHNCDTCVNFRSNQRRTDVVVTAQNDTFQGQLLRPDEWVIVYLTIANCGTFACLVIAVFIAYRYFTDDFLDGNPALTMVLLFANIFLMQTVFPFCMNDEYVGSQRLNSQKILVTTLSYGLLFSIILSRAFFLAFSNGGMFAAHINGYLQSLMIFFMAGVQVAISTMYFLLSKTDSAVVVRSLMFIALLSYDIFLLIVLFIISCFIAQVQRNYREGKCFFGTVIGLLIVWAIWLTCFILVEAEVRDIIVCFGIVSTSLFVIIGILIPRTYYMVTHLRMDKSKEQRFGPTEFGPDPRINTVARRYQQPFYEYIQPPDTSPGFTSLAAEGHPNYYGTSLPSQRYFDRTRMPNSVLSSAYNNYGFHSEMRELENAYVVPQVCVESPEGYKTQISKNGSYIGQMQKQQRKPKLILREKDCIETDIYVEDRRVSSVRRGPDENYPSRCSSPRLDYVDTTIREEEECEESISRTTKF